MAAVLLLAFCLARGEFGLFVCSFGVALSLPSFGLLMFAHLGYSRLGLRAGLGFGCCLCSFALPVFGIVRLLWLFGIDGWREPEIVPFIEYETKYFFV